MGRAGAKRNKTSNDESPSNSSASKKRRTERKKIAPKKIEREVVTDPFLESLSQKFKQPEDAIQFLVQNAKMSVADFIKDHWGQKAIAMKATEVSKDLGKVFDLNFLEQIIEQSENGDVLLIPERDFSFSKVVDKKREEIDVPELTKKILNKHCDEKFAFQFNQPQRFQDCLWSLVEKLESYFTSLVSCQALHVPEGTQSHLRRYDDTQKFILQLSGSTSWKLFNPKKRQVDAFNDDVSEDDVGDEILSEDLSAGDVLYIPKGVIVESKGKETGVYLDFGTCQGSTFAQYLLETLPVLIEESAELTQTLPPGVLNGTPETMTNRDYADALRKLAESIRSRETPLPPAVGLIQTFMFGRLPPFGMPKFDPELIGEVSKDSKILLRNPGHLTWYIRKTEHADMDENDADEEVAGSLDLGTQNELVVVSSLNNERSRHMTIDAAIDQHESDAFSIGVEYEAILGKLVKAENPITVASLMEGVENAESIDATLLANALKNIGAIYVSE